MKKDMIQRSKRLSVSEQGSKVLEQVYQQLGELNRQCFSGMSEDDIMVCIQLMSPVEAALTTTWLKSRGK